MSTEEAPPAEEKSAGLPGPPSDDASDAAAALASLAGGIEGADEASGSGGVVQQQQAGDDAPSAGGQPQPPEEGKGLAAVGGRQQQQPPPPQQHHHGAVVSSGDLPAYLAQLAGCLSHGPSSSAAAHLPGLLHDGASLIGSLCDPRQPSFDAVPGLADGANNGSASALDPDSAALYLYAVGRACDALGSAVLGGPGSASSGVGPGGFGIEHVVRIVSVSFLPFGECT